MYITIKSLWERHRNKSMIARLTGHDWKTVAKKIKEIEAGKEYPKKKPHPRILDFHKEQILEWYVNTVGFGQLTSGIDAAAIVYFGKGSNELSLADLARVAIFFHRGQPRPAWFVG